MTDAELWWITLAAGAVVAAVVGALLYAVVAAARRIEGTLGEVWIVGQAVARNTAHLDLLRRGATVAEDALASLRHSAESLRQLSRR